MTTPAQTLEEIARLFTALPGVEVLRYRMEGLEATIEISIRDASTAKRIERMCLGANAGLDPPVRSSLLGPYDAPPSYSIRASSKAFDVFEFGYLQLLGIDAVRQLQRIGAMPTNVANAVLKRWHGAQIDDQENLI